MLMYNNGDRWRTYVFPWALPGSVPHMVDKSPEQAADEMAGEWAMADLA